jgi:iron complex outermembrane recepter protein
MATYQVRRFRGGSFPERICATIAISLGAVGAAYAADVGSDAATGPGTEQTTAPAAASGLQEVIVTAQKRSQSIQDVSISMVAFTDQMIRQLGMNNVQDLAQYIPNVSFASFYQAGKPLISIRGVSIGDLFTDFEQSPVGVYNDDVFMGSRSGQLMQMFDLDRVEVLRGPQGTLFGRNTTAGAINFISKKPSDQFEADGEVTYGRWNEVDFNGGLTLPISDTLSIRISGVRRMRDGWQFDIDPQLDGLRLDNVDNWGARLLAQWKPTDNMTWLLNFHGNGSDTSTPVEHADLGQNGVCSPNIYTGYQAPCSWNQVSSNDPIFEKLNSHGGSLTGTIGLGDFTITSITAFEKVDYSEAEDDDGSPYSIATFAVADNTQQFSQELRLAAKQGPFDWLVGLYYYTDHLQQALGETEFTDPYFVNTPYADYAEIVDNYPTQTSHNQAVFGDVRYALAPQWTVDLGARYTHESKHLHGVAYRDFPAYDTGLVQTIGGPGQPDSDLNNSWSAPTGRAALEWRPQKAIMSYISWSHGFKSGGYNGLAVNSLAELAPYNPETDNTYEIGAKTTWLDGRLTANAAIFYNKIENLQVLDVETVDGIVYYYVRNAASGTSKGGEFEVHAQPAGGWDFSLGVGLLNTKYNKYVLPDGTNYSGEEFVNAPRFTGNALVQYALPLFGGVLVPNVAYSYKSFSWTDNPHRPGIDDIPGYGLLDANIPWSTANGRWQFTIWGQNLTNKHYNFQTIGNYAVDAGAAVSYHGLPMTYGIRVAYRYQ